MTLMMEDFVRFREVVTPVGVYCLYWQGTVVYVGKSTNLFARLGKHYVKMQRHLKGLPPYDQNEGPPVVFDDVWVKWVPIDILDREEVRLIQRFQPRFNVLLNRPKVDLNHIPAFRELLAKARRQPSVLRRLPRRTSVVVIQAQRQLPTARRLVVSR